MNSEILISKSQDETPVWKVYRVTKAPMSLAGRGERRQLVLETTDVQLVTNMLVEW